MNKKAASKTSNEKTGKKTTSKNLTTSAKSRKTKENSSTTKIDRKRSTNKTKAKIAISSTAPEPKKRLKPIPQPIINFNKQMVYTFDAWTIKKSSLKFRFYRTAIFLIALTATVFWPIQNYLLPNYAVIVIAWFIIVQIKKPIPRFFILLNIMLTTAVIYYTMKIFIP